MSEEEIKKIPFLQRVTMAQNEVKAPKDKFNDFGDFSYRSLESIFKVIKPINEKYGLTLLVSDDIEILGNYRYIKSTATLFDAYSDMKLPPVSKYAREPEQKKKLDSSQLTGSASSYASKYAVSSLYLIDDSKRDPDYYVPPKDEEQEQQNSHKSKQQKKQQSKDNFAERRGSALQRIRQLDQKHNAEEGASYGWIAQRVTGKTGEPMKDITKDNIKLVEDMITYLEQK